MTSELPAGMRQTIQQQGLISMREYPGRSCRRALFALLRPR